MEFYHLLLEHIMASFFELKNTLIFYKRGFSIHDEKKNGSDKEKVTK